MREHRLLEIMLIEKLWYNNLYRIKRVLGHFRAHCHKKKPISINLLLGPMAINLSFVHFDLNEINSAKNCNSSSITVPTWIVWLLFFQQRWSLSHQLKVRKRSISNSPTSKSCSMKHASSMDRMPSSVNSHTKCHCAMPVEIVISVVLRLLTVAGLWPLPIVRSWTLRQWLLLALTN